MQRSKAEVRMSYYRDKEEHMRKEENCNIIAANWKVQEGVQTNICFPDSVRPLCSEVCGEVAEDMPYHYWWPDCCIVQPMYYV